MVTDELKELLGDFLNQWHIDNVKNMTLQKYVNVGDKDTFCQWVETKTRILGSIKGMTSIKFGIYERKDPNKKPKNYENDDKYSWLRKYGSNKEEAFENIKKDIIELIKLSEKGQFEKIDNIELPDLFKWKVAFLYSNERLIPIFKRDVLFKIANSFGFATNKQTKISKIQELMISNKPSSENIYDYMRQLYKNFGSDKEEKNTTSQLEKPKRIKRVGSTESIGKNTQTHTRTINRSYSVEQKHYKIQEALRKQLGDEYGKENVILEENYVDVKLLQPEYLGFYEVKSASYACECIREALGQILFYSYHDQDKRKKKIFVVGQYPANQQDVGYIEYIKEKLNLEFEYLSVEIE